MAHPGGRPSDYRPEYCEQLIQHMESGLSFDAFAGAVGTCRATLYNWLEAHPEFLDAKKIAEEAGRKFWETIGVHAAIGKPFRDKKGQLVTLKNFNATVWIFTMKNRFGWRDRQEIEHTTPHGEPLQIRVSKQSDEVLVQTLQVLSAKLLCSPTKKE